ncbi:MAG: crossover junction endodeoxyribonuclease RuvC [SAR202 cluster bacterium Io17-Chloro-G9]|nr:MAG: crossover junction endodeoxyribonuclease RuvC [SAR202 cluster bacterium Io17-Chloro-G9]
MLVLGIDPGTIRMGYGLVRAGPNPEAEDYGVVALPKTMPLEQRLHQLYSHVLNMINMFQPDAIAVEDPFVGKGDRRFAGAALALGQAQAVVLIGGAGQGVPVFRYAPTQVKLAVANYGAASKEQMQRSVSATLSLTQTPENDAADALSVGLCHLIQSQAAQVLGREILPGQER